MKQWIAILATCGMLTWEAAAENSRLINLDVQVIDSHTGEIPDLLGAHDFQVYDDGSPTPIRNLAIDTPPMDLFFVIYMSNPGLSTREDRQRYTKGLYAAVMSLRQEDRAAVVRGAGPRGQLLPLSGDAGAIRQALLRGPQVQPDKGRLFDAVSSALSLLSEQISPPRRRSIITITDDIERHSETREDSLKESLLRSGVTLHEMVLALAPAGPRVHAGAPQVPGIHLPRINGVVGNGDSADAASLVDLVRATGGENQIGDDFDTALPALLRRLRMRYVLTIAVPASSTGAFHKIEVKLTPECRSAHPDVTVHTRAGYVSAP